MIHTEKKIYEFLKKIMKEKGFNVYRGFLPSNSFEDRENGKKTNDYFPFVILRALEFRQDRAGVDYYNAFSDFEIWVGTKEDKEEDYLKNLEIARYIAGKLLEETTRVKNNIGNAEFVLEQNKEIKVAFYSDQANPYFYSRLKFTAYAEPIVSEYTNL